MAYSESLAQRIRARLSVHPNVKEKQMMGGLTFMLNDKMCVGIIKDEMMCRIAPEQQEQALKKKGCRVMDFTGKPMRGYVMVDEGGMKSAADFEYWIGLCVSYNSIAKASAKKEKVSSSTMYYQFFL